MTRLHFLAGLLFLSGCASSPVEQARTPWEELKQETRLCLSDVRSDGAFRSIADKVTLDGTYDREVYFELAGIKDRPTAEEKIVIRKWAARLKSCYKIKAEGYAYEPAGVAKWAAMTDDEQLSLLSVFARGDLSYGQFAVKRLEIDMKYRGEITRAISADYKRPENQPQKKDGAIPKATPESSSTCGWEGKQWVCRSL